MPHLFDPLTLRGVTLRNRIGMSPMCQYSSDDGFANDWHLVHLGSRAVGGAGMVMVEATAVEARGRISPGDVGIWSDEHVEPLARVAHFIRAHDSVAAIQIAHAGRKASTYPPFHTLPNARQPVPDEDGGWQAVAPSPLPFNEGFPSPAELSKTDIAAIQNAFVAATARAQAAGFNMIELHGAHGYLIHSFHSPLSNQRTDEYGGSFENRIRFTLETVRCIRAELDDALPLLVRISSTDWVDGGWTLDESIQLAQRLKSEGVDLVDCSSGGASPQQQVAVGAGYQVPFAEAIRREADIPTAAVGMITEPMQADDIIRNGRADLVLLGRQLLRDPYWPVHAAEKLHGTGSGLWPRQYHWAVERK